MHIGLNAHLLSGQAGYRSAGIHGYIYNLLAHLGAAAPADWQFTAMTGAQTDADFNRMTLRRSGWHTEAPARRILWEQLAQPWGLQAFDLYHALAFVSPVLLRVPSVVTVYDLSFVHYPQVLTPARRLYLRLFTALSCRRARRVIGISQSTADDVRDVFGIPAERIDVAFGGYDADRFKPLPAEQIAAFRARQGLPDRFWLFVGTLEPRKNLPTLIDAYAALPPSERLPLIIGGGKGWDYQAIFERVQQRGLGTDIHLPGFLPAEDLPLWYNSAETLVYPSIYEGFGLPVVEAMACGTPVIVSDASSLPEVARGAGRLVAPYAVDAWTDALRTAYHDADWRVMTGQQGQVKAAQFTWARTAQDTISSYHRVHGP